SEAVVDQKTGPMPTDRQLPGQVRTLRRPLLLLESRQWFVMTLACAKYYGHPASTTPDNDTIMTNPSPRPLRRILGLGFGVALAFGGTVGVGILRLPGTLAAALGDSRLVELFWVIGGP